MDVFLFIAPRRWKCGNLTEYF